MSYPRLVLRCLGILFAVLLAAPAIPAAAQLQQGTFAFSGSLPDAEIAYVLDGDLWLYNTVTQSSTQLTQDGDARWPAWSPDGMTLLYTRAAADDDMQLWSYDVATGAAREEVENACCGGYNPEDGSFAYVSMAGDRLRVLGVDRNLGTRTLIDPLEYGSSLRPIGPLQFVHFRELPNIVLEMIADFTDGTRESGVTTYRNLLMSDSNGDGSWSSLRGGERDSCLNSESTASAPAIIPTVHALAYVETKPDGVCSPAWTNATRILWLHSDSGIAVTLPEIGYPSFSPDGAWLAAERYLPAATAAEQELEGIVLYEVVTGNESLVIPGGAMPAWRPTAAQPAAVQQARGSNERILTITPPLTMDGARYEVHIVTTGDMRHVDAHFFKVATPQSMQSQDITGLLVTRDGEPVTDAATLRTLFLNYAAADSLYAQPPSTVDLGWQDQLGIVRNNPLFMAMQPVQALRSRRDQFADAFRLLLSDASSNEVDALFDRALEEAPATFTDALDALTAVLNDQRSVSTRMGLLSDDLLATFDGFEADISGSANILNVLRFAARLLWIDQLEAERAQWLATYAESMSDGPGAFDRDQARALTTVLAEVNHDQQQRVDIARDIVTEVVTDGVLDLTGPAATTAAVALAQKAAQAAGVRLAGHAVSSALAAAGIGLTVNDILYGVGPLWSGFTLAQRSDELRARFYAGRQELEQQAVYGADVWDGDLAARWRATWLLETIAAADAQRAYADGIAATFALPNPLQLLNWLRGEDWRQAVNDLRTNADRMEQDELDTFANPAYLQDAVALALTHAASLPAPQSQVAPAPSIPTIQFEVLANQGWQDTGVSVAAGVTISIQYVSGEWSPWPGYMLDANGCTDPAICSQDPASPANAAPVALHAALIGAIGDDLPFAVEAGTVVTAAHAGLLYLRINDNQVDDNGGSLTVAIGPGDHP